MYPALDVLGGRCVRLDRGRRERVTIEGGDPTTAAAAFVAKGARWLHLVDLDGAFSGTPIPGLLRRVIEAGGGVPVQVGGGFRTASAIGAALEAGAARVVIGTAAAVPENLTRLAAEFDASLVVAIDARAGRIVTQGWTKTSGVGATELAKRAAAAGIQRLLVTGTQRDGSLRGLDLRLLEDVRTAADLPVVAAGGVASLGDLRAARELGCEGAIVGSALWSGRFTLAEALAV